MKWEFLGEQELTVPRGGMFGKDRTISTYLWRAQVPGGWFVTTALATGDGYETNLTFYPDPQHLWRGEDEPEPEPDLRLRVGD